MTERTRNEGRMRDADGNEYREKGRFWNKREGEEDNGRLQDEVRAKDAWKMKKSTSNT